MKKKKQEEKLKKEIKLLKESKKEIKDLKNIKDKSFSKSLFDFFRLEDKRYTIEDTLLYKEIYEDGIIKLSDNRFNKMISFADINYQLALEEHRDFIFNQFAGFLNSFDPSVSIQFCFTNQLGRLKEMENAISIPEKEDEFNLLRSEFRDMLKNQLSKGNNGLKKERYIIFSIEAKNIKEVKARLERLEIEILSQLKAMGVYAESLDGFERLKIMHDMLNVGKIFDKSYEDLEDIF